MTIELDEPEGTKPSINEMQLATMKQGAVAEQFNDALQRVLENVVDPNTKAEAVRAVTLKVTLKPDEERDMMIIKASVTAKLASADELTSRAFIVHTREGVKAAEHDPNQGNLYDEPAEADDAPSITVVK